MSHILIADDDVVIQELLSELLMAEGFTTSIANNGVEALNFLEHTQPDLMLLDVMMPKKNGWDTLKDTVQNYPRLPVIMLSAKGESIDRVLGLELGADDYLPKPFDDRELIARIRARIRTVETLTKEQEEEKSEQIIALDGLLLNSAQMVAKYRGKVLDFTTTEFAILFHLAEHRGEIITRDELSRAVLKKRHQPFDRAIDMHLSNIRKKLPPRNDDPNFKWFRAVHGQGYLFLMEQE